MGSNNDTVLYDSGSIDVELMSEAVIKTKSWYAQTLYSYKGEYLYAVVENRDPERKDLKSSPLVSRDMGMTWKPYFKEDGIIDLENIRSHICRMKDSSVAAWSGPWVDVAKNTDYKGIPGQKIKQSVVKADSEDDLIAGKGKVMGSEVLIPYLVPGTGDDLSRPPSYFVGNWGKMLEADSGYLLQAAYSFFKYDKVPRLWKEQKAPAYHYRTYIIYSRDAAKTWQYLSTVASSDRYPLPGQAEGYCEPDILYLGNGQVLCVMRSGGNPVGALNERYTPLVASCSFDGGLSFNDPVPISPYGVAPDMIMMKNGIIVCLSGRPGFFLLFSADKGKTWSTPHWISSTDGPWGQSPSGYGRLIEAEPGILGVAYDEYDNSGEQPCMVTKFRRYRIKQTHTSL